MILYLASDLLWATRIRATAEDVGVPSRPVRTLEMLEARLTDSDPTALVVDLEKFEEALSLISRMRSPSATARERAIRILAFGPHANRTALQAARDAGADEVLPRGAFDHNLPEILLRLARPSR